MAAILEKCSKVHFVCNIFLATSTFWNLEILSFPVIYVLLRPSLGTDMSNFSGLCNGLIIGQTWPECLKRVSSQKRPIFCESKCLKYIFSIFNQTWNRELFLWTPVKMFQSQNIPESKCPKVKNIPVKNAPRKMFKSNCLSQNVPC